MGESSTVWGAIRPAARAIVLHATSVKCVNPFVRGIPVFLALILASSAWASDATKLYNEARKAEKAGQVARAYLLYTEAAALEPANHLYWSRSLALQTRAAMQAKVTPATEGVGAADDAEPEPDAPPPLAATAEDLMEARKPLPPTRL